MLRTLNNKGRIYRERVVSLDQGSDGGMEEPIEEHGDRLEFRRDAPEGRIAQMGQPAHVVVAPVLVTADPSRSSVRSPLKAAMASFRYS